jgi:hypothetical protein
MRRFWVYFIAIVLVAAAAVAIVFAAKNSKSHDDNTNNQTAVKAENTSLPSKNACTVFTLADAKQLLGGTAKGGVNPVFSSTAEFDVSTCVYNQGQAVNAASASRNSATLLMQFPKTDTAVASNQKEFGLFKPGSVQDVAGYGDAAFWDVEHGQLNILKNNTWYIVSYGPSTPSNRTLDQTKQLADMLIGKM